MISVDKQDIQNIVTLRRIPEFEKFIALLNKSAEVLAIQGASIKDDVQSRWNQGRVQELLDILKIIKSADEELRQFSRKLRTE